MPQFLKIAKRALFGLLLFIAAVYIISFVFLTDGLVRPPEIARGLPGNFEEATLVLEHRLRNEFPAGSSVETMILELRRQGFELEQTSSEHSDGWAEFQKQMLIGQLFWRIWWKSDGGRILEVNAMHNCYCL